MDLMSTGSWDLLSFSFQRGFEAMWDQAQIDKSGLLLRPLLFLWRQSVELALKAAIIEICGEIRGNLDHNLIRLFERLITDLSDIGYHYDDEYARNVQSMIDLVQSFDPHADRFRYPSSRGGQPFPGVDTDLDELFQAHWTIITWCEGVVSEVAELSSR